MKIEPRSGFTISKYHQYFTLTDGWRIIVSISEAFGNISSSDNGILARVLQRANIRHHPHLNSWCLYVWHMRIFCMLAIFFTLGWFNNKIIYWWKTRKSSQCHDVIIYRKPHIVDNKCQLYCNFSRQAFVTCNITCNYKRVLVQLLIIVCMIATNYIGMSLLAYCA